MCLGLFIFNAAFLILHSSDSYILDLNLWSYTITYDGHSSQSQILYHETITFQGTDLIMKEMVIHFIPKELCLLEFQPQDLEAGRMTLWGSVLSRCLSVILLQNMKSQRTLLVHWQCIVSNCLPISVACLQFKPV